MTNAMTTAWEIRTAAGTKWDCDKMEIVFRMCLSIAQNNWRNGDLMSGEYETEDGIKVFGPDLLENHHGWFFVSIESVKEEQEKTQKKAAKKEAAEKAETARTTEIFKAAEQTGEKQVLHTFTIDCTDPHEECNMDIVTVWAMSNGSTTETKKHTW